MLFCSHTQVHRTNSVGSKGSREANKSKVATTKISTVVAAAMTAATTTTTITVITIVAKFSSSLWALKQFYLTVSCLLFLCVLVFRTHYFTFGTTFFSLLCVRWYGGPRCGHLKIEWQMWESWNVPFLCFTAAPNGFWSSLSFFLSGLFGQWVASQTTAYSQMWRTNVIKVLEFLYDHWVLCH